MENAESAVFALYCERLAKIIVLISAKIQGNFIDYYMNICYTVFSTFKEVWYERTKKYTLFWQKDSIKN